jgi:phosphomannomutase
MTTSNKKTLLLFDIDGTLTLPRQTIQQDMLQRLTEISRDNFELGFVGGSDLEKQKEQLLESNFGLFYWRFSENGLMAFQGNTLIHERSLSEYLGETHMGHLLNICLNVLSHIDLPIKRGNFIELRKGMLNVSPIGRSCTRDERNEFEQLDKVHQIRKQMIEKIETNWNNYVFEHHLPFVPLHFSIGGQISVDIFPSGWDKTYCLQFLENKYHEIHFFGDKVDKGGNDFEIYGDIRVIGHRVSSPQDTIEQINNLLTMKEILL